MLPIQMVDLKQQYKKIKSEIDTAVLEVIESEDLIEQAKKTGEYLLYRLSGIEGIENVRGRGLMIGFDVPEELKDLKKNLLYNQRVFTGEAKPNVIRLLPSLAITRKQVDEFIDSLQNEIVSMRKAILTTAELS